MKPFNELHLTEKLLSPIYSLKIMYWQNLELNNPKRLIFDETNERTNQPTKHPTDQTT